MSILGGRTPTIAEIAEYSQEKPEDIRFYLKAAQIPFSLDKELEEGEETTSGDLIEDESSSTLEFLLEKERAEQINKFLSILPPQEQKILILRYGLNSSDPKTFREIGEQLGAKQRMIAYKKNKAIARLRSTFAGQNASNF